MQFLLIPFVFLMIRTRVLGFRPLYITLDSAKNLLRTKNGITWAQGFDNKKKRKRKHYVLNEKEIIAEKRHQEARPLLMKAYSDFLQARDLLESLGSMKGNGDSSINHDRPGAREALELPFIKLGSIWQAPLYEISLHTYSKNKCSEDADSKLDRYNHKTMVPIFNYLVVNETNEDMKAEFLDQLYILPRRSCFHMSDVKRIHDLIPVNSEHGFNLIVIDPPWENRNVHNKSVYPTLPNKYLLSVPVKQLSHNKGALVALWVTNREKLRKFVENELLPSWGVTYFTQFYWLKVKANGCLVSDLDLFHHKPYEHLILGYTGQEATSPVRKLSSIPLPDNRIILSVPGDHSRKPPVGKLLLGIHQGQSLQDALNFCQRNVE